MLLAKSMRILSSSISFPKSSVSLRGHDKRTKDVDSANGELILKGREARSYTAATCRASQGCCVAPVSLLAHTSPDPLFARCPEPAKEQTTSEGHPCLAPPTLPAHKDPLFAPLSLLRSSRQTKATPALLPLPFLCMHPMP